MIGATVIASAGRTDAEACWSGHAKRRAIHGFKAHVCADADDAMNETLSVTPGNVYDGKAGAEIVPDEPCATYADSACRGNRFADAMDAIHRVRERIEKIFGTSACSETGFPL